VTAAVNQGPSQAGYPAATNANEHKANNRSLLSRPETNPLDFLLS
jgi:hypothetical protein